MATPVVTEAPGLCGNAAVGAAAIVATAADQEAGVTEAQAQAEAAAAAAVTVATAAGQELGVTESQARSVTKSQAS